MPTNIHFKDCLASGNVDIIISTTLSIQGFSNEEYFPLINIGEISIGSDDDKDTVYRLSNFSVTGYIDRSYEDFNNLINTLINDTYEYALNAVLKIDGIICWAGYVYKKNFKAAAISRTLTFDCVDQLYRLKDVKVTDDPLHYYDGLNNVKSIKDIIKDILTNSELFMFSTPFINDVVYHGSMQVRRDFGSGYEYFNFDEIGSKLNYYWNAQQDYDNLLEMVKNILINYNCDGYVGLDRVFRLIPRTIEGTNIYAIQNLELISEPNYSPIIDETNGRRVNLWNGLYPKLGNRTILNYGSANDPKATDFDELFIDQPGGLWSAGSNLNVYVKKNNNWYQIEQSIFSGGNFRIKEADGNYGNFRDLWRIAMNEQFFLSTAFSKQQYEVSLEGLWDKWNFLKFYKFNNSSSVFRLKKVMYNLYKNSSTLTLRQVY